MPNKRQLKDRKGIHPITTAILLIIALLVIVGIYFIWTSIQNRAGNAIYIQNVSFEQARTVIYVQNIGNGTVTINSVQINNQTFNIQNANCTVAGQKTTTVKPSQTAEITIDQGYNEEIHIRVFCKDGTFHESSQQPKQP